MKCPGLKSSGVSSLQKTPLTLHLHTSARTTARHSVLWFLVILSKFSLVFLLYDFIRARPHPKERNIVWVVDVGSGCQAQRTFMFNSFMPIFLKWDRLRPVNIKPNFEKKIDLFCKVYLKLKHKGNFYFIIQRNTCIRLNFQHM